MLGGTMKKQKVKEKKDAWRKYLASKRSEDFDTYKIKRKEGREIKTTPMGKIIDRIKNYFGVP